MNPSKEAQINYFNTGLMLLSAVLAYCCPFETFLIAYAFLGPLHYLTEISWLHDRNYFSKGKYDFGVLVIIGVLLSYATFAKDFGFNVDFYKAFSEANLFNKLTVFALFSAVVFALVENFFFKIVSLFALYAFVSGWLSPERSVENRTSTTVYALTTLLPTLIHVYVFTGLFILYGALKSRSKSAFLSIIAFVLFPVLLVFYAPVDPRPNFLSDYGKNAFYAQGEGFFFMNASILDHFNLIDEPLLTNQQYLDSVVNQKSVENLIPVSERLRISESLKNKLSENFIVQNPASEYYLKPIPVKYVIPVNGKDYYWYSVFFSTIGILLMRFIAFAYLYHYLNWFSKTEVIRWHQVPRIRLGVIIILWVLACSAYAYDYTVGLRFLFFLSFVHVLLEFPLNILSIIGIGSEFLGIRSGRLKKPTSSI